MSAKTKILIVEDETPLAMMMVHELSRAGCDVLVVLTGKRGMELAQENKFDLIVLDVDLPGISEFEICSELKQRHFSRHTPIVFISARSCEEDRRRSLELDVVDYITKPFDPSNFVQRILSHAHAKSNSNGVMKRTTT
jgi:putative two-component system response regulator